MSVPPGTEMFQFPGFASHAYGFSTGSPRKGGLPHSDIRGSTSARLSPRLIAACHVLHRLLAPRHPPDALLSRPGPVPPPPPAFSPPTATPSTIRPSRPAHSRTLTHTLTHSHLRPASATHLGDPPHRHPPPTSRSLDQPASQPAPAATARLDHRPQKTSPILLFTLPKNTPPPATTATAAARHTARHGAARPQQAGRNTPDGPGQGRTPSAVFWKPSAPPPPPPTRPARSRGRDNRSTAAAAAAGHSRAQHRPAPRRQRPMRPPPRLTRLHPYCLTLFRWWWRRPDSNRRPPACKAGALPLSYAPGAVASGTTLLAWTNHDACRGSAAASRPSGGNRLRRAGPLRGPTRRIFACPRRQAAGRPQAGRRQAAGSKQNGPGRT